EPPRAPSHWWPGIPGSPRSPPPWRRTSAGPALSPSSRGPGPCTVWRGPFGPPWAPPPPSETSPPLPSADFWPPRGPGSEPRSPRPPGHHRLAAGRGLQKHDPEPLDLQPSEPASTGHGEDVARRVVPGQFLVGHLAREHHRAGGRGLGQPLEARSIGPIARND